jgi:hypothetical protein
MPVSARISPLFEDMQRRSYRNAASCAIRNEPKPTPQSLPDAGVPTIAAEVCPSWIGDRIVLKCAICQRRKASCAGEPKRGNLGDFGEGAGVNGEVSCHERVT